MLEQLTRWLSTALDATEREVVMGDLKETGASSWTSFKSVLGLAVRREGRLWNSWRSWIATVGLLPIVSGTLAFVAMSVARAMTAYPQHVESQNLIVRISLTGLTLLFMYSAMAGYALGRLSRRSAWSVLAVLLAGASLAILTSGQGVSKGEWVVCSAIQALFFVAPLTLGVLASRRGWTAGFSHIAAFVAVSVICFVAGLANAPKALSILDATALLLFHWPVLYIALDSARTRHEARTA